MALLDEAPQELEEERDRYDEQQAAIDALVEAVEGESRRIPVRTETRDLWDRWQALALILILLLAGGAVESELGGRVSLESTLPGLAEWARGRDWRIAPLNQLATLGIPEPQLISVKPFDPATLQAIEKAILKADLGLNPVNDGKLIRVPIPTLTEETRKQYARKVGDIQVEDVDEEKVKVSLQVLPPGISYVVSQQDRAVVVKIIKNE